MKEISNKYLREEYISRINRVIDYIEKNLDKDLSLSNLSGIAHFSKFHFHRIFAAMIGETINHFILSSSQILIFSGSYGFQEMVKS